jgi:hypothetical protein
MEAHTCNPSTQDDRVGGLPVQGQPGLYSETLSQNKTKAEPNKKKCSLLKSFF